MIQMSFLQFVAPMCNYQQGDIHPHHVILLSSLPALRKGEERMEVGVNEIRSFVGRNGENQGELICFLH